MIGVLKTRTNQRLLAVATLLTLSLVYIGVSFASAIAQVGMAIIAVSLARRMRILMSGANELQRAFLSLTALVAYAAAILSALKLAILISGYVAARLGVTSESMLAAYLALCLVLLSQLVWRKLYSEGWRERQYYRARIAASFVKVLSAQACTDDFVAPTDIELAPDMQDTIRHRAAVVLAVFMCLPVVMVSLTAAIAPLWPTSSLREFIVTLAVWVPMQLATIWVTLHAAHLYKFIWRDNGASFVSHWECEVVEKAL